MIMWFVRSNRVKCLFDDRQQTDRAGAAKSAAVPIVDMSQVVEENEDELDDDQDVGTPTPTNSLVNVGRLKDLEPIEEQTEGNGTPVRLQKSPLDDEPWWPTLWSPFGTSSG